MPSGALSGAFGVLALGVLTLGVCGVAIGAATASVGDLEFEREVIGADLNRLRPASLPPIRVSSQKHLVLPTEERRIVSVEMCHSVTRLALQRPVNLENSQETEEMATQRANQDPDRFRQPNVPPYVVGGAVLSAYKRG